MTEHTERSAYWDRLAPLVEQAREDREAFKPPEDPPASEEALTYLREGVGPTVAIYVEGRTGGRRVPFTPVELALMERALNDWLSLYARCYGVSLDANFTVREAAKALIDTHNVVDVARVLTKVPDRETRQTVK